MRKRLSLLAAFLLLAAAVLVAGCGEKKEQLSPNSRAEFKLMLDFFPNADHAGIYAAQAAGYFKESGLYLKIILANAHVNPSSVHEQNVGFNLVPALATHKVDAILGGYWNYEGVQLRLAKKHPHILRLDQVGVPTYDELVLVANAGGAHPEGTKIRRFIGALARGARDLRRDPSRAIDGLLKANPD